MQLLGVTYLSFPDLGLFCGFMNYSYCGYLEKNNRCISWSDARPPYFSGRHLDDAGQYASSAQAFKEARSMYKKIQRLEKFADVIINHTATAQFFCRPFVRFAAVGMPIQITINNKNKSESSHTQPIRILHAPSRPKAKGSSIFSNQLMS